VLSLLIERPPQADASMHPAITTLQRLRTRTVPSLWVRGGRGRRRA